MQSAVYLVVQSRNESNCIAVAGYDNDDKATITNSSDNSATGNRQSHNYHILILTDATMNSNTIMGHTLVARLPPCGNCQDLVPNKDAG